MDNIAKNQERIDFLKTWVDDLKKSKEFEDKNKAFELQNEIDSRVYYNTVYMHQQEQEKQKAVAEYAHIQKDMGSAIKALRECSCKDEQLDKAKKEILKRFKAGKMSKEQMIEDYRTAKGIVAHYAKA